MFGKAKDKAPSFTSGTIYTTTEIKQFNTQWHYKGLIKHGSYLQ